MDGLLDAATQERWDAQRAGEASPRDLAIAELEVGLFGVIAARVSQAHAPRTFTRRDGTPGMLRRVTLADGSGEVDMVLWGDEARQAVDGPFLPGAHLVLRGPTVKPGFRGGVELHLGSCVVEVASEGDPPVTLVGRLVALGETTMHGAPPNERFQADATLETDDGTVHVALWDEAVKQARRLLPGASVRIEGCLANPALEGWYVAEAGASLKRA